MFDLYSKVSEFRQKGEDVVIITVTEKEGMGPADVGKKMLITQNGESFGTVGGGAIERYAQNKAKDIFKSRVSLTEKYVLFEKDIKVDEGEVQLRMACGGKATLFYEFLGPKEYVYIFGGGHCGAALARLLSALDYYVTIIDYRPEIISSLKEGDQKVQENFVEYVKKHPELNGRFIVVSTPSHTYDYAVLDEVFNQGIKPKYFGMLCSKKKIKDYLRDLYAKHGQNVDLSTFYSPIGLSTGGDSPEDVALAIASEIQAIHFGKEVKHLRDDYKI